MYYYKELSWQPATMTEKYKEFREKKNHLQFYIPFPPPQPFLQQLHEM